MEKISIKNMSIAQFCKNETTTMFFLKKPSLVILAIIEYSSPCVITRKINDLGS